MKRVRYRADGSYTIEAALLLPIIFSVIAVIVSAGFRETADTFETARQVREQREVSDYTHLTEKIRAGQAAADWFWED